MDRNVDDVNDNLKRVYGYGKPTRVRSCGGKGDVTADQDYEEEESSSENESHSDDPTDKEDTGTPSPSKHHRGVKSGKCVVHRLCNACTFILRVQMAWQVVGPMLKGIKGHSRLIRLKSARPVSAVPQMQV